MAKYKREIPLFTSEKRDIGRYVAWIEVDAHGTLWAHWNYPNGERYQERAHWFKTESEDKHLYSTLTQWDELDYVLQALGVGRVKSSAYGVDWGDGDTDVFRTDVYDFSKVLVA